jgi:hypothetical protein
MGEGDEARAVADGTEHSTPERQLPGHGPRVPVVSHPGSEPERQPFVVPELPHADLDRSRHLNLDALVWALILIWVGAMLLAANFELLDWLSMDAFDLSWGLPFGNEVWALIFLGVAGLVAIEILVRVLVPAYRRNVLGYVILVIIFGTLGAGLTEAMWPLILVAVGVALLLRKR